MSNPTHDAPEAWITSSYSGNDSATTNCVEVGFGKAGAHVRDSKDPEGGSFYLPAEAWTQLLAIASKIQVPPAE
ncbi:MULTISPECIES: DUF397 domain-containing protein [Amycolatopsis]|uniref:DUF397 domain-containing protein n=1 Tax=Amycolatopsis saalfeldensis TaxID=394193 RepID=A0A1H8YPS2_9PSEU|nr:MULTISPECIES: DUF397 domain-containing protein [Amycolatopsis]SEP54083.1 protein of unknown function [Amycolatopsis saalfeldensis]